MPLPVSSRRILHCLKNKTVHHLIVCLRERSRKERQSGDFLSTWPSVKRPRPRLAFRACQAHSALMISLSIDCSPYIKSQIKFQYFFIVFLFHCFQGDWVGHIHRYSLFCAIKVIESSRGKTQVARYLISLLRKSSPPSLLPQIATQKLEL